MQALLMNSHRAYRLELQGFLVSPEVNSQGWEEMFPDEDWHQQRHRIGAGWGGTAGVRGGGGGQ